MPVVRVVPTGLNLFFARGTINMSLLSELTTLPGEV